MTYHIKNDTQCKNCLILFIPFEKNLKCPNCGTITDDYINFVSEMINAMQAHKYEYGNFHPGAWYINSITEHVQELLFQLFDTIEKNNIEDKESYISKWLDDVDWQKDKYLKNHVKDIALKVLEVYKTKDFQKILKRKSNIFNRIRKFMRYLVS